MNRTVLIVIVLLVMAIWFAALANACAPRPAGGIGGGFWSPPIIFGGGWNQGGWDRSSGSSSGSSPSLPSPSRSSGGSVRGGGISGGSGGK